MIPKTGISLPTLGIVLAVATAVAGCATAKPDGLILNGNCLIQPFGAQGNVLIAKVMCEAAE